MRMLLLGCGLQGRAVMSDLDRALTVDHVTCVDADPNRVGAELARMNTPKFVANTLDVRDRAALTRLMQSGFDVVIDMLPRQHVRTVAEATIESRVHLVNTYYDTALAGLDAAARAAGIAILPEMGLDPGIDLLMAAEAVRRFENVTRLMSYGGGIPEPGADDNPLRYRISWTWEGVLNSYARPARLIENGQVVDVPAAGIFDPQTMRTVHIEPFGELEAYPNGDAVSYAQRLGIADSAAQAGRYALRWPGHCAFWQVMARLGFLSATPQDRLRGVSPRECLARLLEPQLQYGPRQRDLVVLRVEAGGTGAGTKSLTLELVDYRDLSTGLMAMNRTVGFAASIAAQMLASGAIERRGVLSPVRDVPWAPFVSELAARGIAIVESAA